MVHQLDDMIARKILNKLESVKIQDQIPLLKIERPILNGNIRGRKEVLLEWFGKVKGLLIPDRKFIWRLGSYSDLFGTEGLGNFNIQMVTSRMVSIFGEKKIFIPTLRDAHLGRIEPVNYEFKK